MLLLDGEISKNLCNAYGRIFLCPSNKFQLPTMHMGAYTEIYVKLSNYYLSHRKQLDVI
jgi:hypothetical protein